MRWALLLVALIGCGGDASPEMVCDHMLEVAKKTGVPISAEGDPRARCVEKQQRMKQLVGDETFKKVAACIMGKSDMNAIMNECDPGKSAEGGGGGGAGAADEYIKKSKGSEALVMLKRLATSARAFAEERASGFPRISGGPTPPLGACCKGDKGRCAPDPSLWSQPPWSDLDFSIEDPHYFSYEYKAATDGTSFTARAYGDLDCDGTYSTFSMTGTAAAGGDTTVGEVSRENPLE
jgi:hypothetical protein